jgi:peptide/nickel transport system substrate-binding protein
MLKKFGLPIFIVVLALCFPLSASAEKTITLGVYQEPENLNTYIGVQTVITYVHKPFAEYLIDVNDKGEYVPVLVEEMPTWKTAAFREDGLTITYKLKKGSSGATANPGHLGRRQVHLGSPDQSQKPGQKPIRL